MPSTLLDPGLVTAPPPKRKRWTRDECARLATLFDLSRYELIDGELIEKLAKSLRHTRALMLIVALLRKAFGDFLVAQEAPISVHPEDDPMSDPEPDAVVLGTSYLDLASPPRPADVRLIVEVCDSTLAFDLSSKRDLYARAGIPEYWALDVIGRRLIVHRDPARGAYRSVAVYAENESVAPLAAPASPILVSSVLH